MMLRKCILIIATLFLFDQQSLGMQGWADTDASDKASEVAAIVKLCDTMGKKETDAHKKLLDSLKKRFSFVLSTTQDKSEQEAAHSFFDEMKKAIDEFYLLKSKLINRTSEESTSLEDARTRLAKLSELEEAFKARQKEIICNNT